MGLIKISVKTRPGAAGGSIARMLREEGEIEVRAIGAGAVNQAVKALAVAREYLEKDGIDMVCAPGFIKEQVATGMEMTIIRFFVGQLSGGIDADV